MTDLIKKMREVFCERMRMEDVARVMLDEMQESDAIVDALDPLLRDDASSGDAVRAITAAFAKENSI